MPALGAAELLAQTGSWWELLREQHSQVPWGDWRGFWLGALTRGRNAVLYFLPLLLVLLTLSRRNLRLGIVLTGLVFIGYVFGLLYVLLWLLTCVVFYWLSEWFARVVRHTGEHARPGQSPAATGGARLRGWLPLAGIGIIAGHFLLVNGLGDVKLPAEWNAWLLAHACWVLPLGARGVAWEPYWFGGPALQLFELLLERSHDVGAAYLTMRMVCYFSEIKRGTIPPRRRSPLHFLAYLCYAPTLIQGPIERFKEFNDQIDTCHERRSWRDILAGLGRMVLGVAKCFGSWVYLYPVLFKLGIASHANPVVYRQPEQIESYALLFFAVHLQVLLLYLVFSGYCDIVIGMSRLLGYRVVENFKRPWLARSLADMWRRWHISLSFILRDYIFFPLIRRRWNNELNLLITFLVCGLWHDLSRPYAAWGLVMGLMVAVNQRWARWMRTLDRHPQRRFAASRRAWLKLQPLPRLCAWLLTINVFLMSGWICFGGVGALRIAWELIRRPAQWLLQGWGVNLPPLP